MADGEKINIGSDGSPPIFTTQPERILRHSISDEELDMLCDSRTDLVLEILLISVGAALGTLPAAIPAMGSYFSATPDSPAVIGLTDFIQILIFSVGVALTVAVGIIFKKKSKRSVSLRDQIRSRTKKQSGKGSNDNPA